MTIVSDLADASAMPAGMATSAKAMASTPRATKQRCSLFLTARNCHNGMVTTRTTRFFAYQPLVARPSCGFPAKPAAKSAMRTQETGRRAGTSKYSETASAAPNGQSAR